MKELEELGKHFLSVALVYINQGEQEKMNSEFLTYYLVLGGLVALTGLGFILWAKFQERKSFR